MSQQIAIAVDAMGGDFGPRVTVPAVFSCLLEHPELTVVMVGDESKIDPYITPSLKKLGSRFQQLHTQQVVTMEDKPTVALRTKTESSLRKCVDLVKEGTAQACVSAGNTGAMMAMGSYVLRKPAGLNRPAICSSIPTLVGHSYLLDLGANVDSSAENLHQYAIMGSLLVKAVDGLRNPKVALLNIGEEKTKGNSQVKEASILLSDNPMINYIGFVEGDSLFDGGADVIVCDGFAGNIALKAIEGVANFVAKKIQIEVRQSLLRRVLGWIATPMIGSVYREIDPRAFNGATFLGLQGVVVKSHGNADVFSFSKAVELALNAVHSRVVESIDQKFQAAMV